MRRQDVLQAGADEKILLLEPQLLALRRGIIRVQHARQVLRFQLLLHGGGIVAGIEGIDMKRGDGSTGPEAQMIDGGTAVTRSQLVESDGVDIRRVDPAVQFGRSRVLRSLDSSELGPEAQMIDGGTAVTRSQLVESDGVDIRRVDPAVQFGRSRVLRSLDSA